MHKHAKIAEQACIAMQVTYTVLNNTQNVSNTNKPEPTFIN